MMAANLKIDDRVSYDGAICTVRYIGEVAGASGSWVGVEWDDATRGKHDGSHKGTRYFTCRSKSPTAASFVRPTRPTELPRSFIAALQDKYTSEISAPSAQIKFSGKVAEEVGFEKIRRKQADLAELKVVILDGCRIAHPYAAEEQRIRETCPKVIELDLSRNLFKRIGPIVDICSELPTLRNLRLNGNRFQEILTDKGLDNGDTVFKNIRELSLEENLLTWEELCHVATKFPTLSVFSVDANQLSSLPHTPLSTLTTTLVSLNLEFNNFTSIADVSSLREMKSLRNLHLKGNHIVSIAPAGSDSSFVFSDSLQYLDVSYNRISSWSFVDELSTTFPGLTHLRFAHNPVYENPDPEYSVQSKTIDEEAYMITIARLPGLKVLNFGTISATDRQDAEMFYLARIGKHMAVVSENEEGEVTKKHKRYEELVAHYGPPLVNRAKEINPAFLEARLVNVHFTFRPGDGGEAVERTSKVPKSFDIYRVMSVAGNLFEQEPLSLRLVWETGEWDPVAGFDEEVEDSEEEGDIEDVQPEEETTQIGRRAGKWVKREVELHGGPRQFGFCVDGLEAKIRVEVQ
ncbi:hypothetical protein BX600DRAFT_453575 [Xylariales sp. PMI_506]|nr:hypothetical protein BX600DRAFT_453575 [Xylariales sp. PMI_506]